MATVKWHNDAWKQFNEYVDYARFEYGKKTAMKWLSEAAIIYNRLQKYPLSYTPEPLLTGKKRQYRSCHIMRRFKLVYYYSVTSDTVYIKDIWDTKMNPETLRKRLK